MLLGQFFWYHICISLISKIFKWHQTTSMFLEFLAQQKVRITLENLLYVTTLAIASSSQLSKVNLLFSLALCFPWLYNIPKVCTLAIFSYLQPFNPILCVGKNVGEMHNLYSNPFSACKPSQNFCQEWIKSPF